MEGYRIGLRCNHSCPSTRCGKNLEETDMQTDTAEKKLAKKKRRPPTEKRTHNFGRGDANLHESILERPLWKKRNRGYVSGKNTVQKSLSGQNQRQVGIDSRVSTGTRRGKELVGRPEYILLGVGGGLRRQQPFLFEGASKEEKGKKKASRCRRSVCHRLTCREGPRPKRGSNSGEKGKGELRRSNSERRLPFE